MSSRGSFGVTPTTLPPSGPASGDLAGTFPNPTVSATHLSSALPVAQGGTGSITENFVDLTNVQTITGNKTFTGTLTIPAPVNSTDAATKAYADGISAGVSVKMSVAAATTAALPANTYNNGSSGVGATLTANAVGVLIVDGYTVLLNDRLIVKNEAAPANNGIYTVSTLGTASVAYVLTRSTDMNTPTAVVAAEALINNGTVNNHSSWIVTGSGPYTIGTTAINWTQFTSPGSITAGTGINVVGSTVSLVTPVSPANLPSATTSALGIVQLTGDLANTANSPQVVSTHLSSALPLAQGGTAATTAGGARTSLGLGTAAVANIDTTPTDIANLGSQAAGGIGQVADAGHVHNMPRLDQVNAPTASVNLNNQKITNQANGTLATDSASFGQIPTTLPPSGAATGDLAGTYPAPTLSATSNVNTIIRANRLDQMAVPAASVNMNGQKLTNMANGTLGTDAITFQQIPGSLPPNGPATGDLTGTYPAPTLTATTNVNSIVRANRLDQMAAPTAAVSMNGQKLTGLGAATLSTDAPQFGQVLPLTGGTVTGTLNVVENNINVDVAQGISAGVSTGLLSGGAMSINGGNPAAVDIQPFVGYVVDYVTTPLTPTVQRVSTNSVSTVVLSGGSLANGVTYISVDKNGTFFQTATVPTSDDMRNRILFGATLNNIGVSINAVEMFPSVLPNPLQQVYDLMESIGPFNISGNVITGNSGLTINQSSGSIFNRSLNWANDKNSPHIGSTTAQTPASFRYGTATSTTFGSITTAIDPANYDVGGTITPVPGGTGISTIQRIWISLASPASNQIGIQYGNATFSNLGSAQAAAGIIYNPPNPQFVANAALVAYMCITKSATATNNTSQCILIPAAKFATF